MIDLNRQLFPQASGPAPAPALAPKTGSILDEYVSAAPSVNNAFDIFRGTWSSQVPGIGLGYAALFSDHRIQAFIDRCGGVLGKDVLELGPLEGGHTWMLSKGGARVTAIEANPIAFLKCLIVKNALQFDATFLLGDFRHYLNSTQERFDLVVASGVLYHMTEPWTLLRDISRVSRSVGIWTHYFDPQVILSNPQLSGRFESQPYGVRIAGRDVISHKYLYLDALNWKGFCGGGAPNSRWLTRDSLMGLLSDLGYAVSIIDESRDHVNGPCITLFCQK